MVFVSAIACGYTRINGLLQSRPPCHAPHQSAVDELSDSVMHQPCIGMACVGDVKCAHLLGHCNGNETGMDDYHILLQGGCGPFGEKDQVAATCQKMGWGRKRYWLALGLWVR